MNSISIVNCVNFSNSSLNKEIHISSFSIIYYIFHNLFKKPIIKITTIILNPIIIFQLKSKSPLIQSSTLFPILTHFSHYHVPPKSNSISIKFKPFNKQQKFKKRTRELLISNVKSADHSFWVIYF